MSVSSRRWARPRCARNPPGDASPVVEAEARRVGLTAVAEVVGDRVVVAQLVVLVEPLPGRLVEPAPVGVDRRRPGDLLLAVRDAQPSLGPGGLGGGKERLLAPEQTGPHGHELGTARVLVDDQVLHGAQLLVVARDGDVPDRLAGFVLGQHVAPRVGPTQRGRWSAPAYPDSQAWTPSA